MQVFEVDFAREGPQIRLADFRKMLVTRDCIAARLAEEQQLSEYSFDRSDAAAIRQEFELHEKEAKELLEGFAKIEGKPRSRFPVLAAYDHCLKCSHLFNMLDARGVISTTERAALMARVRNISCRTASAYLQQIGGPTVRREVLA